MEILSRIQFLILTLIFLCTALCITEACAEDIAPFPLLGAEGDVTALSLEQLMSAPITSVSRRSQRIGNAAAAVFVLTQEDIRRSSATSIPELLRLVPGLDVAQIGSRYWAVSTRGFNGLFANKLLVLIDGRTVYTPLFAGTFWDQVDVMLEDIDRIEVIRGPGSTLWGANAVNGVISIITKSSKETQGLMASGGGGTEKRGFGSFRYGGMEGENTSYRVYGKYLNHDNYINAGDGRPAYDGWSSARGGFRIDSVLSEKDNLTIQGDGWYGSSGFQATVPQLTPPYSGILEGEAPYSGADILGRWTRAFSEHSELQFQMYYDRIDRDDVVLEQSSDTIDFDLQHRFRASDRHDLMWGMEYRFYRDNLNSTDTVAFSPESRNVDLFSWFAQDNITVLDELLHVIIGSKFEHNDFTGFEFQPNVRVIVTPNEHNAVWAAVSRGMRTPSRSDDDILLSTRASAGSDGIPVLDQFRGSRAVRAEELIAYEVGYRTELNERSSIDIATFYNSYDDLMQSPPADPILALDGADPYVILPYLNMNGESAEAAGAEISLDIRPLDWWRIIGSYSYLHLNFEKNGLGEGESPQNQFVIRSMFDLPWSLEFDPVVRYVDTVPSRGIGSYNEIDARLAWRASSDLEISVVGQNLLDSAHEEYVASSVFVTPVSIERGVFAKVLVKF